MLEHERRMRTAEGGLYPWLRQFEPGSNSADANRLLDRIEHLRHLGRQPTPARSCTGASRHSIVSSGFRIGLRAARTRCAASTWISPIQTETRASSAA